MKLIFIKSSLLMTYITLLLTLSCGRPNSLSQPKFITHIQDSRKNFGAEHSSGLLIHKVHAGITFNIKLGDFVAPKNQNDPQKDQFIEVEGCQGLEKKQIQEHVHNSLVIWLDGLKEVLDDSNIRGKSEEVKDPIYKPGSEDADLQLYIRCGRDEKLENRSYTYSSHDPIRMVLEFKPPSHKFSHYPMISKTVDENDWYLLDSTITHEIGHAFGLADLYEFNNGDHYTYAQIKHSIMFETYSFNRLTFDDKQGLLWLYSFYKETNIRTTDCLDGYYLETNYSNGCVPFKHEKSYQYQQICAEAGGISNGGECICEDWNTTFDPFTDILACNELGNKIVFSDLVRCGYEEGKISLPIDYLRYYPREKLVSYMRHKKESWLYKLPDGFDDILNKVIGSTSQSLDAETGKQLLSKLYNIKTDGGEPLFEECHVGIN